MKERNIFFIILAVSIIGIYFGSHLISADDSSTGYCCERLADEGLWCQNVLDTAECDSNYDVSTKGMSCDQTSFCTLGTCVDQSEGICSSNVPQQKCTVEDGGYWTSDSIDDVSQCQVGCCVYGNNAALTTETRCILLSAQSGVEADFDSTTTNEATCLASVDTGTDGACVYENSLGTTKCERLTRSECSSSYDNSDFYEGELCSNPDLGTICGMSENTICSGYDVYFVDTCGNLGNIYDASKVDDVNYWSTIQDAECDDGSGNIGSKTCGQCEPNLGSKCQNYQDANENKPNYGDNICADLRCEYNGKTYYNGESWCADYSFTSAINIVGDAGSETRVSNVDETTENVPGSSYEVLECRDGQILQTQCDYYRNEVCAQSYFDLNSNNKEDDSDYTVASCVANRWEGCILLNDSSSCEDTTNVDCQWVPFGDNAGICVPKFSPGFDFWSADTSGSAICNSVSTSCTVGYSYSILKSESNGERMKNCVSNCYCIPGYVRGESDVKDKKEGDYPFDSYDDYIASLNLVCSAMGDCGSKVNYIGKEGADLGTIINTADF